MHHKQIHWLAVLSACSLFLTDPAALHAAPPTEELRHLKQSVGFYHWGGIHATSINQGIEEIAKLGGQIARITLSARYRSDYNKGGDACIPGFTLAGALRDDADLRAALANPHIRVLLFTIYDGASFDDCATPRALTLGFHTPANTAAMEQEYSDFVLALHQLFAGTGKQFILSNWEGDNWVYCGSAYNYAYHEDFRQRCDQIYPQHYLGNTGPAESLQGMVKWLQARSVGLAKGKARAAAAGFTGIEVLQAPEIVSVRMLHDRGLPSVLYDVIPLVNHDFISYSAYESLRGPDVSQQLSQDLDTISYVSNGSKIIIGEAGFARSIWANAALPRTLEVSSTAMKWGVSYTILWNLFDQETADGFGLFDSTGAITELGLHFQRAFTPPVE